MNKIGTAKTGRICLSQSNLSLNIKYYVVYMRIFKVYRWDGALSLKRFRRAGSEELVCLPQ